MTLWKPSSENSSDPRGGREGAAAPARGDRDAFLPTVQDRARDRQRRDRRFVLLVPLSLREGRCGSRWMDRGWIWVRHFGGRQFPFLGRGGRSGGRPPPWFCCRGFACRAWFQVVAGAGERRRLGCGAWKLHDRRALAHDLLLCGMDLRRLRERPRSLTGRSDLIGGPPCGQGARRRAIATARIIPTATAVIAGSGIAKEVRVAWRRLPVRLSW